MPTLVKISGNIWNQAVPQVAKLYSMKHFICDNQHLEFDIEASASTCRVHAETATCPITFHILATF